MAGSVSLKLKKFPIEKVPDVSKCMFIGKTNTGKSFCMTDLLSYHTDIPVAMVINGTEFANRQYSDMVPGQFIHDKYTPDLLKRYMVRQFRISNAYRDDIETRGASSIDPRAILIMDDCLHDSSFTKDEMLKYLFYAGRHVHTMFLFSSQYPLGIPPTLRSNLQYIFLFREPIYANRKRLYDNYAGMFPTFDMFCHIMDQCTEDYHCLVLDMLTKSNKLEDQVFWYKAQAHPPFRLCAPIYWETATPFKSSLALAAEEGDDYDPSKLRRKTAGPAVYVKRLKH